MIGKKLEALVIEWLAVSGVEIELDTKTYFSKSVPMFQGHFDGIVTIKKKKYILEIKTAKDASFKIFVNKGAKVWNPQYYAQIQSYMGFVAENKINSIDSTYVLVLNKDNSDLCDELVTFEPEFYKNLEEKALMISQSHIPPPKINGSPLWYQCKMCKFRETCHG